MPYKDKTKRAEAQKRYRQRNHLKAFHLEDGSKVIPIRYECPECHKTYQSGFVHADAWPIQKGWLCPVCQETLPHTTKKESANDGKTTLLHIDYAPKIWKVESGNCEICKAWPCKHTYQVGFDWHVRDEPVLRDIFSSADSDWHEQHELWKKKNPEAARREAEGLPSEEVGKGKL